MTRAKKILAVVILFVVLLLVGYSCFTGSRLTKYPNEFDGYKNQTFRSENGTMLAFAEEYAWYSSDEQEIVLIELNEYNQGVFIMTKNEMTYKFTAIDGETIYDEQTKEFLIRRGADG